MAEIDAPTIGLIAAAAISAVAGFFEVRLLRKKMKNRRIRAAKHESDLPDESHNAVTTTKAILASLERQGIRSDEAANWAREAEVADSQGHYRVALDLTRKAKDRLLNLKAAQTKKGDIAKLEQLSTGGSSDEVTVKEKLTKEVAPNLLQSKFSIEVAQTAVEEARLAGRDVEQATQLLQAAQGRFEAKEYDAALTIARQSRRAAAGEKLSVSVPVPVDAPTTAASIARPCPSCGASLRPDDVFCRKCGTRFAPTTCASCGVSLLPDDAFCGKCGALISR